jgi:hypothetical protein
MSDAIAPILYASRFDAQLMKGVGEMNRKFLGLLAAAALAISFNAHAQLTSVDNGLAVLDTDGLMFANIVQGNISGGSPGNGAAWVATLNTEDYGGYNNWTFATGNATHAPNNTNNQLGQLLLVDCAVSCSAFTALTAAAASGENPATGMLIMSASDAPPPSFCAGESIMNCGGYSSYAYIYHSPESGTIGESWFSDNSWNGSAYGNGIAVRDVVAAPELNVSAAMNALTLLIGGALVLRSSRKETRI